jgi:hypothetical protein
MHSTSHSQSVFQTSVNGKTGSTQTRKGAWSGTQAGPRPIKGTGAWVYRWDSGWGHSITLELHITVFQSKVHANRACIMENTEKGYTGRNIYFFFLTLKQP